ncbi:MAG: hypothetical protein Q8930_00480 [Bacillota bacterium]|nr:hypothetical protein [Bacillota bacterium]
MGNNNLAPHEAVELHEFLDMEILGIKRINSSMEMVKDPELKNFMQDSINSKKAALKAISMQIEAQNNMQNGGQQNG